MRRAVLALCLGFATAATAQPPAQSDPAIEASILKTSCPTGDEPATPDPLTVQSEKVPLTALEGSRDRVGKLLYLGGVKLTSEDPRFGDIIGLQYDPKLGLVAVTGAGNWIVFDAVGPDLLDFKSIRVAPLRGSSGAPTALARIGQSFIVATHDGHNLERYELNTCGLAAHAAPLGGFQTADHVVGMASASYSYTLFSGVDSTGARRDFVGSKVGPGMKLADAQFPAQPGYDLVDVAGPEVIVPYDMIALWRRAGGGSRTRIQAFSMPGFSDVRTPNNAPASYLLADLPLPMRAATGFYDAANRLLRLWIVSRAGPKEPTYLLSFATPSVSG